VKTNRLTNAIAAHNVIVVVTLLAFAAIAQASDACEDAYWDGTSSANLDECLRLAKSGDPGSEFRYGLLLWTGHDRASQPKEAALWLRRAAEQGYLLARVTLGRLLSDSETPPDVRNLPEGYAWWVVGGENDAAAKLKHRLTASELAKGEQIAKEFAVEYGLSHKDSSQKPPPTRSTPP
jgi:TPR repeat protein